jgi:hypothetical protein
VSQNSGVPTLIIRPVIDVTIKKAPMTIINIGQTPNHCVTLSARSRTASDGSDGLT